MLKSLLAQRVFINSEKQVTPIISKFDAACQKIETDPSFKESITDQELLEMIVGANKAWKNMSAVAIIKSALPITKEVGQVYEIRTAQWEHLSSTDMKPVVTREPTILRVNLQGEYSFHRYGSASKNEFHYPLKDLDISHYLVDADGPTYVYGKLNRG